MVHSGGRVARLDQERVPAAKLAAAVPVPDLFGNWNTRRFSLLFLSWLWGKDVGKSWRARGERAKRASLVEDF